MKLKKTTVAFILGLLMGLGPWLLLQEPSFWWYPVSVFGGLLVMLAGRGAQMEMLGQGDTAEELLDEIWNLIKSRVPSRTESS